MNYCYPRKNGCPSFQQLLDVKILQGYSKKQSTGLIADVVTNPATSSEFMGSIPRLVSLTGSFFNWFG